ncbi:MAG: TonB-dependent receptor [Acidobacteria bacterium]|nr:TonB-dependent receptor [Acidobacteriota bacterium]
MKWCTRAMWALLLAIASVAPALAQGGGASATGTIQGRVSDEQGAVLPGVTVTATSPALLGEQTTVTSETGNYRFPAVPPGTYTLTYELAGFNTLRREGVQITLGFTANLNVELSLATLQETVTVSGASPVIDTTSTRVQQNFKLEQLNSIPNGRDMWSLLAVTPAVQMARIDVGGNRAGTQTGYTAYGFTGQVRVLIEGINTTEGTDGAGFYFDYSSLEEVFMGTTGQGAEMPNPGVQSQFIAKSGGNQLSGEYYLDWYNNSLQGSNIPDAVIARGVRPHSNEMDRYYDTAINVGGPIKKDKIWYFGTYRTQFNAVGQPNFLFDQTFDTELWNPVVKGTYQVNQKNKIIGYYQWGQKVQPNRLPQGSYTYTDPGQTFTQDSGSWVWKGEWNGTISDKLYVEARFGDFGYYFPQIANSDLGYWFRDTTTLTLEGSPQRQQSDRDRKQITGAATYFLDTGKGSHTIKIGGEINKETQVSGFLQGVGGNRDLQYNNGRSSQIVFWFPTATDVGTLSTDDNGDTLSQVKLDVFGAFINDTWNLGRLTVNGGVRWDRYRNWLPEQYQMAFSHGTALLSIPDQTFPEVEVNTFNSFAPRLGMVYDLSGDGRSVIKANYGLFWHNTGVGLSTNVNPNQASKNITLTWNDLNGDRRWQPGEEGAVTATNLAGTRTKDPNLKQPYTHEFGVFFEQQLAEVIGSRIGFVYKTEDDLFESYQTSRPPSAYTVPFAFTDIGLDGARGTADDRVLTLYGMPAALASQFPVSQVVANTGLMGRYKTVEASVSKRYANRWSASVGGSYTIRDNFPTGAFPQTPNHPGRFERTSWDFKATGSYDAPWGIRVSPVLRHQSGQNFAREISVAASAATPFGLIIPGTTIYADNPKDNREPNITVLDIRAEKTVDLTARMKIRAFFDLFNVTNSSTSETITRTTGPNYLRPSAILAPRTARLGFRFLF